MSLTTIDIRPLSASLGAEIHGIDLARPLDAEAFARVERAFLDHLAACRTEVRENGCGRIAMWRGHGIERLS